MSASETMRTLSLELACQPAALVSARDAVRDHLLRSEIDERTRNAIDLSLDELLGNTIRHGAGERACRASLTLSQLEHRLLLVLEDDARPFDPTTHPEPERPTSLATARIGGLGISMVRKVVGSMRYSRQRDRNHLELVFELESPGSRR